MSPLSPIIERGSVNLYIWSPYNSDGGPTHHHGSGWCPCLKMRKWELERPRTLYKLTQLLSEHSLQHLVKFVLEVTRSHSFWDSFTYVYVYVGVYMTCIYICRRSEEGIRSLPDMDIGNQTLLIQNSGRYSYPLSRSSPSVEGLKSLSSVTSLLRWNYFCFLSAGNPLILFIYMNFSMETQKLYQEVFNYGCPWLFLTSMRLAHLILRSHSLL